MSNLITDYVPVQLTNLTYDSRRTTGINSCQRYNLSVADQFIAPVGSIVGLYSYVHGQLLCTNASSSVTTFQFNGNQSSGSNDVVHYNIAIRVHLG